MCEGFVMLGVVVTREVKVELWWCKWYRGAVGRYSAGYRWRWKTLNDTTTSSMLEYAGV